MLTVRKSRNQEAVLLGNHKSDTLQDGAAKESSKPQESGTVMVKLLTATKVPAGHRKAQKQRMINMPDLQLEREFSYSSQRNGLERCVS